MDEFDLLLIWSLFHKSNIRKMRESFIIQITLPVRASILYSAWLDSSIHGTMTNTKAEIDPVINGKFSIWNGYITGSITELIPYKKIVQRWRTTEFKKYDPDSVVRIVLRESPRGTNLKLRHSKIPAGQGEEYKKGWKEYYFKLMKEFFSQ